MRPRNALLVAIAVLLSVDARPQHGHPGPQPGGEGTPGGPSGDISVSSRAIARYDFEDAADIGKDSIAGHDLTPNNSPTTTTGVEGLAVNLVNASSQDLRRLNDTAFDLDGSITTCAYVKPTSFTANIDPSRRWVSTTGWILRIAQTTGVPAFYVYDGDSNTGATSAALDAGEWYHICGVASPGFQQIYVNGSPGTPPGSPDSLVSAVTANFLVGTNGSDQHADAAIDRVLIFDYALSAVEILALYQEVSG